MQRAGHPLYGTDGLHLQVGMGESVAVIGPSGVGKSTLLAAILDLLGPSAEVRVTRLEIGGAPWHRRMRGRSVALLPQDCSGALDPLQTVDGALREHARIHGLPLVGCLDALAEVGLDHAELRARRPHQLSGGQRQRLVLAMALAVAPTLLLLDEPTSALDGEASRRVAGLLRRIRAQHPFGILLVTHDPAFAEAVADRVLRLDAGGQLEAIG